MVTRRGWERGPISHTVTLSRSEGSVAPDVEMLRSAQHDSTVTHTASWINVLHCIFGPLDGFPNT